MFSVKRISHLAYLKKKNPVLSILNEGGELFSVLGNLVPRKRSKFFAVFFLDTDQKISELVARLWRGWRLPRKRWLWWLWEEERGSSMSVLGNTTESHLCSQL